MAEARVAVEQALGGKLEDHFVEFGPPVAAASIAQVHKAYVIDQGVRKNGRRQNSSPQRREALPPRSRQLLFRRDARWNASSSRRAA